MTDSARYGDSIHSMFSNLNSIPEFIKEKEFSQDSILKSRVNNYFLPYFKDFSDFFNLCEPILKNYPGIQFLSDFYLLEAGEKNWEDSGRNASWCVIEKEFLINKSIKEKVKFSISAGITEGPYITQPISFEVGIRSKGNTPKNPFIIYLWENPIKYLPNELDGVFLPKNFQKTLDTSIKKL